MERIDKISTPGHAHPFVGRDPAFLRTLESIKRVAPTDASVLLLGETGTGKEVMVARGARGQPARRPARWCGGLLQPAETLFESELFGHERGAFTGANAARGGLVEAASGGTLFLDEVGDIPLAMQVKLLRLLETGTYRRVGSTECTPTSAWSRPRTATWHWSTRRPLPRRPVLPAQHLPDPAAGAARAARRHPAAGGVAAARGGRPAQPFLIDAPAHSRGWTASITPATCASCATSSSVRACSPTTRASSLRHLPSEVVRRRGATGGAVTASVGAARPSGARAAGRRSGTPWALALARHDPAAAARLPSRSASASERSTASPARP